MRHIGHKITPHRLSQFNGGDVARQQQFAVLAISMGMYRQVNGSAGLTGAAWNHHIMRKIVRRHVGAKAWRPDKIGDVLQHIATRIKPKVLGRHLVAPFNAVLRVQQHHAAG